MCLFIDMKKSLIISFFAVLCAGCGLFTEPEKDKPKFDEFSIMDVTATAMRWESRYIVTALGAHTISEFGFMYSDDPDLPYETAEKDGTNNVNGYYNFGNNIDGLKPNTTYYGCLYCLTTDGKTYKSESQSFKTHEQGDFSQAKVKSPINDDVVLNLLGCYRQPSEVLIEMTIKNIGIENGEGYRIYAAGSGQMADGKMYTTYVQDNLYTDYTSSDVQYEMNGQKSTNLSGGFFSAGNIPLNSTKKLKVHIIGVPKAVNTLDVYIMSYFYNYPNYPAVYMTLENVPIY